MLTPAARAASPEAGLPVRASDGTLRVLLVEDDEGDAFEVTELLDEAKALGHVVEVQVLRATRVSEALELLADLRVDCVLLDLGLPDVDDLDGLVRVRRAHPGLPVVVLTGRHDAGTGLRAVGSGAQDYLLKGSSDGEQLVRSVRYAVERMRADEDARALGEARLLAAENARLERGLLPRPLVAHAPLEHEVAYRPGRRRALLGGDFYDLVECADGWVRGVVGDVSGHGPDEAALGVSLRVAWRTLVLAGTHDDEVLPAVQRVLEAERPSVEVFATALGVAVHPVERRLRLWVAGHPPAVLVADGASRLLEAPGAGPALGIVPGPAWSVHELPLPERWSLLVYTDGLVEGHVPDGGRLGEDRLVEVVARTRAVERDGLARLIDEVEELNGGPLADDVACLRLSPLAGAAGGAGAAAAAAGGRG